MSRMNVLWVIDHVCYDGSLHGGGRLYWSVLPHFEGSGIRVVPCLLRATPEIRRVFRDSPVPVRILDKGKFDPSTLWTLLRIIKEERIDAMHLHCYGASTFGRLAGVATGVPTVIQDYDTEVYFPYPWYLWLADTTLAGATARAIAPSPMVRDFLVRKRKIDNRRITTMFHAVPPEEYAPVARDRVAAIKRSLDIGPDAPVIGTVTKLGPQRGNDVLLDAAARLVRAVPSAVFLVIYKPTRFHRAPDERYVGAPPTNVDLQKQELLRQIDRLGISASVRLAEWPEDVGSYVSACDVIVAPFLSERFSSVHLLNAMARGKPLVATALGEQREIVRDGENGYLVPPGDAATLADRLQYLLHHPAELRRMGQRARQDAEAYSAHAYARNLEAIYADMVSRSTARRAEPAVGELRARS